MSKFTFTYEHKDIFSERVVTKLNMETDAESLNEVLEEFENFLRGAGYFIDGNIVVVPEDSKYSDYDNDDNDDGIFDEFDYNTDSKELGSWPYETKPGAA